MGVTIVEGEDIPSITTTKSSPIYSRSVRVRVAHKISEFPPSLHPLGRRPELVIGPITSPCDHGCPRWITHRTPISGQCRARATPTDGTAGTRRGLRDDLGHSPRAHSTASQRERDRADRRRPGQPRSVVPLHIRLHIDVDRLIISHRFENHVMS